MIDIDISASRFDSIGVLTVAPSVLRTDIGPCGKSKMATINRKKRWDNGCISLFHAGSGVPLVMSR